MWGQLRMVGIFIGCTFLSIMYFLTSDHHRQVLTGLQDRFFLAVTPTEDFSKYLVYGKNCRIGNLDPMDKSILRYIEPTSPVVCSALPPLTRVDRKEGGHVLVIDQMLVSKYKLYSSHRLDCCYSVISRISQTLEKYNTDADSKYKVGNCKKFSKKEQLKNTTEFIHVKCKSIPAKKKQGKQVYENAHALVPSLPKINQKQERSKESRKDTNRTIGSERLNVLIIGIDSISRLSLRRTMPNTLDFFQREGWLELDGYNKIADNTMPNVMAILAGRTMQQLNSECRNENPPIMDNCPNIWKDFRKKGYVTAYAEDVPSLSTFNYRLTGFVEQPTDIYMRPFMLAAHSLMQYKNKDGLPICVGPDDTAHHIFGYAKDFATTFRNANFFGLFWLNSFSHNNVNSPAALDLRLLNLLKELKDTGAYDNSLVLVLSDHGIRFGEIRNTFMGFLEERLPFIFFHLPKSFIKKYPNAYRNLIINKNRLTSPFDLHATLKEILGDEKTPPKNCPKCKSLFLEMPRDRSCDDAGIDPHWCTCHDFQEVSPKNPLVIKVGQFLGQRIHNRTQELLVSEKIKPSMCENRTVEKIIRTHRSKPHGESEDEKEVYVTVIQTVPFGLFEATIQVEKTPWGSEYQVMGFISRLDSYFSTAKCVSSSKMLQFYCYCSV